MRLIDADELMQTYAKFVAPSNNSDFENEPTWNDAVSLLESAPTVDAVPLEDYKSMERTVNKLTKAIADAVEVVQCKDCKYYRTRWYGFCELIENENIHRDDNDFCSFGERRKDADT